MPFTSRRYLCAYLPRTRFDTVARFLQCLSSYGGDASSARGARSDVERGIPSRTTLSAADGARVTSTEGCAMQRPLTFVWSPFTDVYMNLALEEAVARSLPYQPPAAGGNDDGVRGVAAAPPPEVVMFYVNRDAVVVGAHQNVWQEANVEYSAPLDALLVVAPCSPSTYISGSSFLRPQSAPVSPLAPSHDANPKRFRLARRYSGGGTVTHDVGNLCVSFIRHRSRYRPTETTEWVRRGISAFLAAEVGSQRQPRRGVGAVAAKQASTTMATETSMAAATADPRGVEDGVRSTARHDVTVNGKKVSGSAMSIKAQLSYHHLTVLVDSDLDFVRRCLKSRSRAAPTEEPTAPSTNNGGEGASPRRAEDRSSSPADDPFAIAPTFTSSRCVRSVPSPVTTVMEELEGHRDRGDATPAEHIMVMKRADRVWDEWFDHVAAVNALSKQEVIRFRRTVDVSRHIAAEVETRKGPASSEGGALSRAVADGVTAPVPESHVLLFGGATLTTAERLGSHIDSANNNVAFVDYTLPRRSTASVVPSSTMSTIGNLRAHLSSPQYVFGASLHFEHSCVVPMGPSPWWADANGGRNLVAPTTATATQAVSSAPPTANGPRCRIDCTVEHGRIAAVRIHHSLPAGKRADRERVSDCGTRAQSEQSLAWTAFLDVVATALIGAALYDARQLLVSAPREAAAAWSLWHATQYDDTLLVEPSQLSTAVVDATSVKGAPRSCDDVVREAADWRRRYLLTDPLSTDDGPPTATERGVVRSVEETDCGAPMPSVEAVATVFIGRWVAASGWLPCVQATSDVR